MNNMLEFAIRRAAEFHAGKIDKIGEPYILHPIRVMLSLNTEDERVVAILHDIIEDTSVDKEFLEQDGFPKYIVDSIVAISRNKHEKLEDYICRVSKNSLAKKVKYADIKDNMSPSRLNMLDHATQERLKTKYLKSLSLFKLLDNMKELNENM